MSAAAFKEATAAPATALRQRKAGRVNYIIESSTPAMLCLVRGAQSKSYTPLTPEDLYEAVQPHDLSLRPSPYIAHQSLIDFYRICDGYYGVESDEVDLHQLTVGSHSKNHSSSSNNNSSGGVGGITSSTSATLPAPSFSAAATAATASAASTVQAPPPLPSPDDPNIAVKLNDYRIAQLRRNAVHIDNKVFHGGASAAGASGSASSASSSSATASTGGAGVCHFYRTPVGCHRGAACPFLHLEKTGSSASRSPFGTGKK